MVIHGSNSSDVMIPMITCVASGSQNIINGEMKRDQNIEIIISRLKVNNMKRQQKCIYSPINGI